MQPVWLAFCIGMYIGALIGVALIMALYTAHTPDERLPVCCHCDHAEQGRACRACISEHKKQGAAR